MPRQERRSCDNDRTKKLAIVSSIGIQQNEEQEDALCVVCVKKKKCQQESSISDLAAAICTDCSKQNLVKLKANEHITIHEINFAYVSIASGCRCTNASAHFHECP